MRLSPLFRPLSLPASLATFGWLVASGCSSDSRVEHYPIRVSQVLFADSVQAGSEDSLIVFAVTSVTGCAPEGVALVRSGDSLEVSGTFRCVFEEGTTAKPPGDVRITTPPAEEIESRVVLALPDLEVGTFRIVAEGWPGRRLADTLVVAAAAPVTRDERLAAFGSLFLHEEVKCSATPVAFVSEDHGSLSWQQYLVENPPGDLVPSAVEVNATIAGPATCDSTFAAILRLRSATPLY